MRDNGMLNSQVFRRCAKAGYQHLNQVIPHFRDPTITYPNGGGLRLQYWQLSSSEQELATLSVLAETFPHWVDLDGEGRDDRAAVELLLEHGWEFQPWTHILLIPSDRRNRHTSRFCFSHDIDALKFKLLT